MRLASVDELALGADVIVLAEVHRSFSAWHDGRIFTDHEVVVLRAIKGSVPPGSSMVVRTLGGIVDGIGQRVSGAARLTEGAKMMLCLVADRSAAVDHDSVGNPATIFRVVGMWQGAFLLGGNAGDEPSPQSPIERGAGDVRVLGETPDFPVRIGELEAQMRSALNRGGGANE